jgi:hypothetical protein
VARGSPLWLTATFFIVFLLKTASDVLSRRFTGRPENQLGSRGLPKCHDGQSPNCDFVGRTSRYVALSAAPHPACLPGNSVGACHPRNMRLPDLGLTLGCRPDTHHGLDRDHGPDPSYLGLPLSQNQPGSRGPPKCPCHQIPNCSLLGREIRYAVALAELGLANQLGNSVACRHRTSHEMVCPKLRGLKTRNAATTRPS